MLVFNVPNWFDSKSNKPTDDILSLFTIDEFGKWQCRKERPHANNPLSLSLFFVLSLSLFCSLSLSLLAIVCVRASVTIVLSFPLLINTHKHKQRPLSVFLFCNLFYLTFYLCFMLHTTIVRILRLHSLEQTRSSFFQFNHCQDLTRIAKI